MRSAVLILCVFFMTGLLGCSSGDKDESFEVTLSMDNAAVRITGTGAPEIVGFLTTKSGGDWSVPGETVLHRRYNATIGATIVFKGSASGSYSASRLDFEWDGIQYQCATGGVTVSVERYGEVGEKISGSFSGTTCDSVSATTPGGRSRQVRIADGSFSVPRVADNYR